MSHIKGRCLIHNIELRNDRCYYCDNPEPKYIYTEILEIKTRLSNLEARK